MRLHLPLSHTQRYTIRAVQTRDNTPYVDVSLDFIFGTSRLRSLTIEDNVVNVLFFLVLNPPHPIGLTGSGAKVKQDFRNCKYFNYKIIFSLEKVLFATYNVTFTLIYLDNL